MRMRTGEGGLEAGRVCKKSKWAPALWSALVLCAASGAFAWRSAPASGPEPEGSYVDVSACGDVMMQNVDQGPGLPDRDLLGFMREAKPWFGAASVSVVNLEGPIGGSDPKSCSGPNCYRFNQGPLTAQALREAGVTAVGVANNHSNDMGASGQRSTLRALESEGLRAAGFHSQPSARWMASGKSVELLAFTANGFAPDFRRPDALAAIAAAKARSDLVIVSAHMGCEGEACARLAGGREIHLGEDRGDPVAFSRAAIDHGADLVLGSGPHAPRGLGLWRGKLIAYSLGNCAVGPGISSAGKAGQAPILWARLDLEGKALAWDVGSFKNNGRALSWDGSERALQWMLSASALDNEPGENAAILALRRVRSDLRP